MVKIEYKVITSNFAIFGTFKHFCTTDKIIKFIWQLHTAGNKPMTTVLDPQTRPGAKFMNYRQVSFADYRLFVEV